MLFKNTDRSKLTNWQPITLLNTTHKIFAKALQRQLQPLLVEVIDNDQTAFLPLPFILENNLLTFNSIQWAKESRQESILLNLTLAKPTIKLVGPLYSKL
jgi:hypothetical protein